MESIYSKLDTGYLRVGLIYNLKKNSSSDIQDLEAEYDSIETVMAIKSALEDESCQVELFEATKDLPDKLMKNPVDIVFNIAEGTYGRGREAQVPAILNFLRIPFTGSDETTLCLSLDKALTKRVLATYHIRTPKYDRLYGNNQKINARMKFPVIVKPNAEGSSKGITNFAIASDRKELSNMVASIMNSYGQDILVEEYIDGREFTVGVLGNNKDLKVFPPMEIIYTKKSKYNIYSYEIKQNFKDVIRYESPAKLTKEQEKEIIGTSRKIYQVMDCKDFARIDFRLSLEGKLYFIEINPLPGLAPGYSDYPMIAEFNGTDYVTLVRSILSSAIKRYGLSHPYH